MAIPLGVNLYVLREISRMMACWILPPMLLGVWVEMLTSCPKVRRITRRKLVYMDSMQASCKCLNADVHVQSSFHRFPENNFAYWAV